MSSKQKPPVPRRQAQTTTGLIPDKSNKSAAIPGQHHRNAIKHRSGDGTFKPPPSSGGPDPDNHDAGHSDTDQPATPALPIGFGDEGFEG
jgi:hypothetical protein